jgi:transcriptional regulator with XRE-family HTH domain
MNDITPKILENLRDNKGWSKTEVARRLGIKTVSTYANWEYGIRTPDKEMLAKIANLYDVSIDFLITGKKGKSQGNENLFYFDLEGLSEEDIEHLKEHIEFLRKKAKQYNDDSKKRE